MIRENFFLLLLFHTSAFTSSFLRSSHFSFFLRESPGPSLGAGRGHARSDGVRRRAIPGGAEAALARVAAGDWVARMARKRHAAGNCVRGGGCMRLILL